MRRYAVVQKARDADVFGILVGTLGVGEPYIYLRSKSFHQYTFVQRLTYL